MAARRSKYGNMRMSCRRSRLRECIGGWCPVLSMANTSIGIARSSPSSYSRRYTHSSSNIAHPYPFLSLTLNPSLYLSPQEGSRLPELPEGANRLSAPRALKMSRVAAHVERTLHQQGVDIGSSSGEGGGGVRLYCGEKPLPPEMSLLTSRTFLWKQGGDMMLTYVRA